MEPTTILVANTYPEELRMRIETLVPDGFRLRFAKSELESEIVGELDDIEFLIAGGRLHVTEALLQCAPRLRLIHRTGVGYDRIDVEALKSRGIPLVLNPGVNATAVAEHSVLLLLAVLRNLSEADRRTKAGEWPRRLVSAEASTLQGLSVGVVGMGHVGQKIAGLTRAFGAHVTYTKRNRLDACAEQHLGITHLHIDELIASSDAVILACALTNLTRGLIDEVRLRQMRVNSIIINASRGELIDEYALLRALDAGHLRGAGLDVFCKEPPAVDDPLLKHPRVIATPHIAGLTASSLESMYVAALSNIVAFDSRGLAAIEHVRIRA